MVEALRRTAKAAFPVWLVAVHGWVVKPANSQSGVGSAPVSIGPGGKKLLTLEEIMPGPGRVDFDGRYEGGFEWLDDGKHYLKYRDGKLMRADAASGEAVGEAYDMERMKAAMVAEGIEEEAAKRLSTNLRGQTEDRRAGLVTHEKRVYLYRLDEGTCKLLTKKEGEFPWLTISPKGRYASFVRDHELYVIDAKSASPKPRKLTSGGGGNKLNAEFDWVYAEELYSHGSRAYWWSPDEKYIAYLQFDETEVPRFTVMDHFPRDEKEAYHPIIENTPYPKAGDANPKVRLGVVRAEGGLLGGGTRWVDLSKYEGTDILVVRVGWSPWSTLLYQVQDREQRWLDFNAADASSGKSRTHFREQSPAWVDVTGEPRWMDGGGAFLWLSQRDGYQHIYRYAVKMHGWAARPRDALLGEELVGPVRLTSGDWEVREVLGVDETGGWVYFTGTRDGEAQIHAYRAPLDGSLRIERVTEAGYSHRVELDPTCTYFIDTYSNAETPPRVRLCKADGAPVRVISENRVEKLEEYAWGKVEYLRVPARDGFVMNALLISPPEGVPPAALPAGESSGGGRGSLYPVWSYTYSGPHAPSVHDRWGGAALVNHLIAQRGYYVWICDNRSASGASAVATWQNYLRLGETELADLEDGLRWLIANRPVDPQRIGLYGHSYGGFQTCYAMTHSTMFKIGVAGAPVTDWRCYDTIYTERYMRTPQNNPEGYERTSPTKKAERLSGRLLIMHGTMDDNVHLQNSALFIHNLQKSNKRFEFMLYPSGRHGLSNPRHVTETRLNFIFENL